MRHATTFNEFRPSVFEALYYLKEWRMNAKQVVNKQQLDELFLVQPFELSEQSLSAKIHLLNSIYKTRIQQELIVPGLMQLTDLSDRMSLGDLSIIDDISKIDVPGSYQFASKFCHHHNPIAYPFYTQEIIQELQRLDHRDKFFNIAFDKRNYMDFYNMIQAFRSYYGLETCSWFYIDILLKGSSTLN